MKINFYKELEKKWKEICLIHDAMGILEWDKSTMMPEGSYEERTEQLTNLNVLSHKMTIDKQFYGYIKKSEKLKKLNSWERKNLKLIKKLYIRNNVLDAKLLRKISKAESSCEMQWRKSKSKSDFKSLIPKLEEVIKLTKIKAKTNKSGKDLFMPLRLALTGKETGPELKYLIPLLKKEQILKKFVQQG